MGEFIENNLDIFYWLTIVMLAFATFVILAFSLKHMINNKKAAKKTLLTAGGLTAVLLISYFGFASDEILSSYQKYNIDSSTSNMVGMGIWSFYILSAIAVGSIIVAEFSKKFSK
jgi:tellurite resistance protein TehA-like permease